MHHNVFTILLLFACQSLFAQNAKQPITVADMDSIHDVTDPQISPDTKWVAYTVSSTDFKKDQSLTDIWMTSWDGNNSIQLTHTDDESESTPRWSPDNMYLAFLSSRKHENDADQIWLLNRAGGEAKKITDFPGGVEYFTWSPDGKKIALIANLTDTNKNIDGTQTPAPVVIDRFYFKEDVTGYMTTTRHHLYVLDIATGDTERIVDGNFNEDVPAWSPDGKSIAFVSKRARDDFDRDDNFDIYVVDAKAHSVPRQLTTSPNADNDPTLGGSPVWSPDGKYIAYMQGGPEKLIYYATVHLAVIPSAGGEPKVLTASYDRNIIQPHWSADGSEIYFIAEDDQNLNLDKVPASGGEIEQVIPGRYTAYNVDVKPGNKIAVQYTTPSLPEEIFVQDENGFRQLTHQNDGWISRHQIPVTKEFTSTSKDGTKISGFYVLPYDYQAGKKFPAILQIHGGPTSQNQNEWMFDWLCLASNGYVLVSMNPRGSTTKGEKFATGIYADWGNKDAQDVLSGVDELVKRGIANPDNLAVEGWSYGSILTNYVIAQDTRFKCAISGAGISDLLAGYGTDMYVREYEEELGTPWKNSDVYLKLSFPFLHADRIKTPTLFMGCEKDYNVPLHNAEQMYEALKSLGIETKLIIFPDQNHEITIPSYLRYRMKQDLDWYASHLKKG